MSLFRRLCVNKNNNHTPALRLLGKTERHESNDELICKLLNDSLDFHKYAHDTTFCEGDASVDVESHIVGSGKDALPMPVFQVLDSNIQLKGGQTFNMWKASLDLTFRLYQLRRKKRILYIQQLEDFPSFISTFSFHEQNFTGLLAQFMKLFFLGFDDVIVLPQLDITHSVYGIRKRSHPISGSPQLLVSDVQQLVHQRRPRNAVCLLGITWTDLYPCDELNFVLGEGSCNLESAVMCFGHFDANVLLPSFQGVLKEIREVDGFLLWKLFKVMSHEVCHVLGIQHCVYFHCLMNESTSLTEAMSQPFLLCPVCLKKLRKVCKFDVVQRYQLLRDFLSTINDTFPYSGFTEAVSTMDSLLLEAK